jgi:hypothetical protein
VAKISSQQELYLETGDYSYPFQVLLPANLPTSFENSNGHIRYSIRATVDIPWALDKHSYRSFTFISPLDLNSNPALALPCGGTAKKVFCCGLCKSNPILVVFKLMKGITLYILQTKLMTATEAG